MARDICPKCSSFTALGHTRCFKCGYITGYNTSNFRTLLFAKELDASVEIPEDLLLNPNNFHLDALEWLYGAHLTNRQIIDQNIGYCPSHHQVFVPALWADYKGRDKTVMWYTMRSLSKYTKYKYKSYGNCAGYLIHYRDFPESNRVVLVEDHLSAIRLRRHSNVLALSGTSLLKPDAKFVCERYNEVVFWLDPDQPGIDALYKNLAILQKASESQAINSLFLYDKCTDIRFSKIDYTEITQDPKKYTDFELHEILTKMVLECD